MPNNKDWLIIGLITSPHGIDGKVKVKSLSDFPERFTKPGKRWIQKYNEDPFPCELIAGSNRPGKDYFIVSFKEFTKRDQAENLRKHKLLVKADDIPNLQKGEFHLSELINLEVKILDNDRLKTIGKVYDLENEKTNLLIIKLFKNNKKVLVPFVKKIITHIDKEKKLIIIDPPKGLLEL